MNFPESTINYIRVNHLAIVSIIVSLTGAVFAFLAYRLELISGRNKFNVILKYRCNDSHASISVTNVGVAATLHRVDLIFPGGSVYGQNCSQFLKHGADTSFSIESFAFNKIPVNVECRIVITLSDDSTHSTEQFVFKEKCDTAKSFMFKLTTSIFAA